MTKEMRKDLTPQDYIRQMFCETKDGKLSITYYPYVGEPETITYQVNWAEEDTEQIVQKYNLLTDALSRIGRLHDQLEQEENRKSLLTATDLEVWNTYIRPYDPFEMDLSAFELGFYYDPVELQESIINAIHERGRYGDLVEEEETLWIRYCIWREEQSQKRIPFNRRSSAALIRAARRYEKMVSMDAPESVVTEEGRCLAEEMVLYYAGKEEPIVWE